MDHTVKWSRLGFKPCVSYFCTSDNKKFSCQNLKPKNQICRWPKIVFFVFEKFQVNGCFIFGKDWVVISSGVVVVGGKGEAAAAIVVVVSAVVVN